MKINEGKNYPVCITAKKGNMTEIDPNFFIVSVGHGQPKDHKYRYIKRFLFPVENRPKQPQTVFNSLFVCKFSRKIISKDICRSLKIVKIRINSLISICSFI